MALEPQGRFSAARRYVLLGSWPSEKRADMDMIYLHV